MDLKKHIRSIKDYPKKGILFRDITTLIKNPEAFKYVNDKIVEMAKKIEFDKVSAIESRGFIFASTVSYILNKPFILLRKKNKLPAETHSVDFKLEYGEATVEVHKDSISKGERILVIDDLIATGGTAEAAAKLIELSGGNVAAFIFVINLFDLPGDKLLKDKGYKTESIIEFPGH
jgi:adenine phosphoribosyltransferase